MWDKRTARVLHLLMTNFFNSSMTHTLEVSRVSNTMSPNDSASVWKMAWRRGK